MEAVDNFRLQEYDFFVRLLVAAGIGFVLGLEREYSKYSSKQETFAGVRTFTLVSLTGFLTAFLSYTLGPWIFLVGLLGVICIVGVSYWISASKGEIGSTTEFATILAYLLGGLTLLGHITFSLALTVTVMVVLSLKIKLKNIIGQINQDEFSAFVRFVIIALLVLPFLPDKNFGPFEVINPREVGWVIVLTSGIGFIGYVLMKFLGTERGILLTGIVGGMVSSTVVTWTFSKKSKEIPHLSGNYAIGIFAAASVMVVRVFAWILIFNPSIFYGLVVPLSLVLAAALGITLFFYKKQQTEKQFDKALELGEPLNIKEALFFGFLYTGILLLVSYASKEYGDSGIYLSSAISALTDIDAIAISVSKLAGVTINYLTAQNAILLATLANTIVKIGITLWTGSKEIKKYILIGYGLIFFGGILGFLILNL